MNKSIYVIRFSSLGDILMTIPVLYSFNKSYPDYTIYFITKKKYNYIIDEFKFINGCYWDDNKSELYNYYNILRKVKSYRAEKVIDLHNVIRSRMLTFFVMKSVNRLDKRRNDKKELIKYEKKKIQYLKHRVYDYLDVFLNSGFDFEISIPPYIPVDNTSEDVKIGIAPFSKHSSKEIDLDTLKVFIESISKKIKCNFFLFGNGKEEASKAYKLINISNVYSYIEGYSFSEQLKQISKLDIMISSDSANGHIASIAATKVVTVWGCTHYCLGYFPFGNSIDNSIFPDTENYPFLPVSIYGKCKDKYYSNAIKSITAKQIEEKILRIIK